MKPLLIISLLLLQACATSMSPRAFIEELPKATKSKYIDKAEVTTGNCTVLAENRKYVVRIGLAIEGDVSNGASGVDEWVTTDKGNAYIINNLEWISVGDQSTIQLIVHFNTLLCR
jgi:hypothetical protein